VSSKEEMTHEKQMGNKDSFGGGGEELCVRTEQKIMNMSQ
jgi:hypothetical protein